ncbi:MAG: SoxR reducing system RseC family protein [Gammaproteobacteria bacterium]|nr:SoxR reducing system RseC family protein [Gammaproteobacteria bacterium]MCF6261803.1 SoxR reducing system RseC family protein [Gammaproteobacteria bacterium]
MIEEHAQVIALENNDVWVETQRRSACGQCAANKGCGTATLARVLGNKRSQVRTLNPQATSVAVGDEVVIGINEQALVRGSLAVYTVPLLMLFFFGFLGQLLSAQLLMTNQDILPIVLGLSGLLLGFVWVRRFTRRIADDARYQPVLLRRVIGITLR